MEDNKILTFELSDDGDELHVFGNQEGLEELLHSINSVLKSRDHDHLMTPEWAGQELTSEPMLGGGTLLNHVKIHFVKYP
ncbi:MAG: immunity protein 32 [Planctomycetes bacterium]|nr:immunity protein 32 [Planctomycetota bacterium]NUQ33930.1 immunity protein 32 [Planctomycetaceae bacterium]